MIQWLRLCVSNAGAMGSIPGWRTRIPQAAGILGQIKQERKYTPQQEILIRDDRLVDIYPPK